jgi:hypothetical protein
MPATWASVAYTRKLRACVRVHVRARVCVRACVFTWRACACVRARRRPRVACRGVGHVLTGHALISQSWSCWVCCMLKKPNILFHAMSRVACVRQTPTAHVSHAKHKMHSHPSHLTAKTGSFNNAFRFNCVQFVHPRHRSCCGRRSEAGWWARRASPAACAWWSRH